MGYLAYGLAFVFHKWLLFQHVLGANIVVGPEVEGTISVRFNGVPWREALELGPVGPEDLHLDRARDVAATASDPEVGSTLWDAAGARVLAWRSRP